MPISGHCVGSALPDERQPPFAPPCAPRLSPDGALLVLTKVPLYYLPPFRHLLNGDGKGAKFPCSISWMTRRGLPRLVTLVLWNAGWLFMARAFVKDGDIAAMSSNDWARVAFMLQMYATGFVTLVLTPMQGPDVAMGSADALHCHCAMIYVARVVGREAPTEPLGAVWAVRPEGEVGTRD